MAFINNRPFLKDLVSRRPRIARALGVETSGGVERSGSYQLTGGPFNQPRAPLIPAGATIYQVSANNLLGFTVRALAGLVARNGPKIFPYSNSQDEMYFKYAVSLYGYKADATKTASQLISMFKSAVSQTAGAYNIIPFSASTLDSASSLNYTALGACTLAGVYDALPVEAGSLAAVQSALGLTHLLYDLRKVTWGSSPSTGQAFTHALWFGGGGLPSVSGLVSKDNILMSPNAISGSATNTGPVDYSVMVKSFCFQTMSSADFAKILGSYNPGAYWRGWFNNGMGGLNLGEPQGVTEYSKYNMIGSASNRFGGESFYSGCPIFFAPQTGKRTAGNLVNDAGDGTLAYSTGQTYVMWMISQGGHDFTGYNEATNVSQVIAQKVVANFLISLDFATIAPPVLAWYYEQQKNAGYPGGFDFIGFNSGGLGYYHPDGISGGLTGAFNSSYAVQASLFCNALGVHGLYIAMGGNCSSYKSLGSHYTDPTALNSFWYANLGNNTQGPAFYESTSGSGLPVITVREAITIDSGGLNPTNSTIVSQIKLMKGQFVLVVINTPSGGDVGVQIKDVMTQLGSTHVAVRGDEFYDLINEYKTTHGSYPQFMTTC